MMPMWFWRGYEITYLINGIESSDGASYALGWFGTFFMALLLEALLFLLTYLTKVMQN